MKNYINSFEEFLNEAEKFKATKDFEDFLEEIDGMDERSIKLKMGKDYIDTPGSYRDEADDYDNDITEYMIANMGRKEFEKLKAYWETNIKESAANESKEAEMTISGLVYHQWNDKQAQRKLNDVKFKIVSDIKNVMTLSGEEKELDKVRSIFGIKESAANESKKAECVYMAPRGRGSLQKYDKKTATILSDDGDSVTIKFPDGKTLTEVPKEQVRFLGESAINESVWADITKSAKPTKGPWTLVSSDNKKVLAQSTTDNIHMLPAHFESLKLKFPKSSIHIESASGEVIWKMK